MLFVGAAALGVCPAGTARVKKPPLYWRGAEGVAPYEELEKASQSFFAAAKKEFYSFFAGACTSQKTLLALQVCEHRECAQQGASPLNAKPSVSGFALTRQR